MAPFFRKSKNSGFVLPSVVILSLVVLTLTAIWYKQVTLQSYLAKRVIEQKARFLECKSLVPFLKEKLEELTSEDLLREQVDFITIGKGGQIRWKIAKSAWINNQVKFTFYSTNSSSESDKIVLTTYYAPN